jgi:uncharacterized protein (TIGR03435 family)
MRPLLKALLEDRFKLRSHIELRPQLHFELIFANEDRKLGPNAFTGGCAVASQSGRKRPTAPAGATLTRACGVAGLLSTLSRATGAVVIDKTRLTQDYEFYLAASADSFANSPAGATRSGPDALFLADALREQLGLKLESARTPLDVLVIDAVDRPTEN